MQMRASGTAITPRPNETIKRIAIAGFVLIALASAAHAQSSLGIGTAEPSAMPSGPGWPLLSYINEQQQNFYRALSGALKDMRSDPWKLASLIGLSFAYGVFHAAGPGHGKAVISSYMIANEVALRRGVVLSFLSSFLQGVTAIVLVGGTYLLLRGTTISMGDATWALETASYGLIAAFGGWLLWKKLKPFWRPSPAIASGALGHHGHHHHHNHHSEHHSESHSHGETCPTCGHSHAPDPAALGGQRLDLREAWSAIIAVGMRPCSGALLVLTFSLLNGLYLGGILSVFAMALGTAITVSTLAIIAVSAKDLAVRLAGPSKGASISTMIEISGALLVLTLGLLLLGAAFAG